MTDLKTKYIYTFLIIFLIADLSISFFQYYNVPIDGDLPMIVAPSYHYADVLQDPLGIHSIQQNKPVGGMGRFSAHWSMHTYYHHVPLWLQTFVEPIASVYLASALFMLLVQLLLMIILAKLITQKKHLFHSSNLLVYALLTPLFQTNFNYDVMGLIDHAPTYVFFYAWPIALFLLCFAPFYKLFFGAKANGIGLKSMIWGIPLYCFVGFCGPLIPPITLIWNAILSLCLIRKNHSLFKSVDWKSIDFRKQFLNPFCIIIAYSVIALYAYYLGSYNIYDPNSNVLMSWSERYSLLAKGLLHVLTDSYGFSLLVLLVIFNCFLINRFSKGYFDKYKGLFICIGIFCVCYLLLLPLGGYRPYRPYIIRYDTLIPVTLSVIFLYLHSSYHLINSQFSFKRNYMIVLSVITLGYFASDLRIKQGAKCERLSLKEIESSTADTVILINGCNVLSWEPIHDPKNSLYPSKMLQKWNIMKQEQFYMVK